MARLPHCFIDLFYNSLSPGRDFTVSEASVNSDGNVRMSVSEAFVSAAAVNAVSVSIASVSKAAVSIASVSAAVVSAAVVQTVHLSFPK